MPGTRSDQPRDTPGLAGGGPGESSVRGKTRLVNLYATPWHLADAVAGEELTGHLGLGRLAGYYQVSAEQLPRVLLREELDVSTLGFRRWRHGEHAAGARVWLFLLASGQVVAAVTVDVDCELRETIDLLEDCYYGDVLIGETPLAERVHELAGMLGAGGGELPFLPERHQIVFDAAAAPDDCDDLVQRLVYRVDLPYRKEFSAIRYPPELNRRPGSLAAVGPYVSVMFGQQDYVENAVFASAVQGVAAAAQLRAIRQAAYADVRLLRSLEAAPGPTTRERRQALERMADQLGDLELELSYSVEASADLGLLVPSLRVESFHNALYESMGLAGKAVTTGRMLSRLAAAISAELTAIESIERRMDENRRVRYAVAVGFVSAVAIPASLILAFLGINASQVNSRRSMFSGHYLDMYLAVGGLIAIGAALSVAMWVQHRRDVRQHRATAPRPRWTPVAGDPPG